MARSPSPPRRGRKPARPSARHPAPPRLWGKDELLIERMSQEGRGVASRAGKIVFVSGALEGETARVQCTATRRDYDEADMIGLAAGSAPSPARVRPACGFYEQCGGCSLQHWALAAQQQHKQEALLAALRPLAPKLELEAPITGAAEGFRHRLRLVVTRGPDRSYSLGFRQRRSRETAVIDQCLVAGKAVNATLRSLPGLLAAVPELQGLREIEIDADSDDRVGLCFYFAARPGDRALSALRAAVLGGSVIALRVRLNARKATPGRAPRDEEGEQETADWEELHAEGELCLRLAAAPGDGNTGAGELQLAYLPGDFSQTHWEVNARLVERALAWLQPAGNECALDLFAGIGNFSLPLARRAGTVYALEGSAGMTLRLEGNARRNSIGNISARTLNLMAGELALPKADIAIVDPPRAGAKAVCEALSRSKLQRLVYISCHPATLARDARILQAGGLELARAAAVDMFPHTGHSEAIALFRRRPKR